MLSSGADFDVRAMPDAPLMAAARLLAERGVYGLVWIDENLFVTAHFGKVVAFAEVGERVTEAFWPLVGLESEILALRQNPGSNLNLPSVAVVREADGNPRLNVTILWSEQEHSFLMVVSRANTKADLEVELSQQIRARLMAEAEVTRKSQELARANGDLEEYASVISHDLKTPLRHLRYLSDTLDSQIGPQPDGEARSTLSKIKEQSLRMSRMLSALLEYSSIGRKEEAIEIVDTRNLVQSIINSIPREPEMNIKLAGHYPVIVTLAAPLDLVIRNLVSNAVRHHDRAQGVIRIAFDEGRHSYEISIADDGPGIDKKHQDAIFLPFRRLDTERHPDGQGMGLSLVKRTVESVGGRIAVRSDPGTMRGATFIVTWPKSAAAARAPERNDV